MPVDTLATALKKLADYRTTDTRESLETFESGVILLKSNAVGRMGDEGWAFLEQLALAAIDVGRLDIADECLRLLSDKFPGSPRVDCLKGIHMEATKDTKEVLKYYDQLLEVDPANAPIWKRKISVYRQTGRNDDAAVELSKYLDAFYSDVEGWLELTDIHLSCQNYDDALKSINHALLLSPQNPFYVLQAAEIAYSAGDITLAIKMFLIVVDMTDGDVPEKSIPTGITVRAWFGIKLCARRLLNESRLSSQSASVTPPPKNLPLINELATERVLASYSSHGRDASGPPQGKAEVSGWIAQK